MPKSRKSLTQEEEDDPTLSLLKDEPEDDEGERWKRRNMLTLVVTSSLNILGYGIYETAYSQWIYVRFQMEVMGDKFSQLNGSAARDPCYTRGNTTDTELESLLNLAQAEAAHLSVLTTLCSLLPSLAVNLLLGACSDQIGRRVLFIVPMAGRLVRAALVSAVAYWNLSTDIVLVGYTVSGFSGDYVAFVMAVYVYTADNSTEGKNRSFLMVVATAIQFVCYNLSQLACGFFIDSLGYVWPMVAGLASMFFSFVLVIVFLRETLDQSTVERVSLCTGIKGLFSFYWDEPVDPMYRRKDFLLVGVVFVAYASSVGSSISTMFLMNEPFCWGSKHIGYVNSAAGVGHAVLSTLTTRLMQKFCSDELLVVVSLLSSVGQRFVFAFAKYDWHLYIGYAAGSLEVSVLAVIRAIASRMVRKEKRGSLFASMAVLETATLAASGAGLNELYSRTVGQWPGLTFFAIGCTTSLSAALMLTYKIVISNREPRRTRIVEVTAVKGPDNSDPSVNS